MQVTCQICRKKIERDTAYKRVVGKANKYYCSETEWQQEEDKKKKAAEDKEKAYRLVCDIMGEKEIINTALYKEWQVWNKVANNEKIAKYLEENKEYLTSVMTRLGSSEYARIRYLSAIIRDKIKGFVPKVEVVEKPKVVVEEHYKTKYKSKLRVALEDLEEDCDE
jgi:hypothetical protein